MIEIDNVSKWYGDFRVLNDCSTGVDKGEVVVVCGPSGSGKSTLIKCVNGLEPFQEGKITVDGVSVGDKSTNLPRLRSQIGMLFQNFELFPHMTALENICLAQTKVLERKPDEAIERGMKLLERVGLVEHAAQRPGPVVPIQDSPAPSVRAPSRRRRSRAPRPSMGRAWAEQGRKVARPGGFEPPTPRSVV